MCQGPVSQWPMIEPGVSLWKYHGCQTASGGGRKLAVASWSWRSSRPTRQIASSLHGCGLMISPSM
jgi:hypothetical protein